MPAREEKLVDDVLASSSAIRYCSIIDKQGNVIAGGRMRKGVESLEPSSLDPKLITQLAILLGTDKSWDAYLGQTDYFLIHKHKVNLLLFPISEVRGVVVSTEPSYHSDKLDKIQGLIKLYDNA
jgi:hypothetical protein